MKIHRPPEYENILLGKRNCVNHSQQTVDIGWPLMLYSSIMADENSEHIEASNMIDKLPIPAGPDIDPALAPETPLEHARRLLDPFLKLNPTASIEQVTAPTERIAIINPWGDTSLIIYVPENVAAFASAINELYLPRRFTAIWHRDTKELEIIFTAFKLTGASVDLRNRKFEFSFKGTTYVCEFGASSDRLITLAKGMRPTGPSSTQYRIYNPTACM